jgi:hypothetical protein
MDCYERDKEYINRYVSEFFPTKLNKNIIIDKVIEQCLCYLEKVHELIKGWKIEKAVFIDLTGLKIKDDGSKKLDRVLLMSARENKLLLGIECKHIEIKLSREVLDEIIDDIEGKVRDFYSSNLLKKTRYSSYEGCRKITLIYLPLIKKGLESPLSQRTVEKFLRNVYNKLKSKLQNKDITSNLKIITDLTYEMGKWRNLEIMMQEE